MKKILPLLIAVACGAAFAQNAPLDKKDRAFLEKAATGDMLEIEAGKMGEQKAQDPGVKSFASMLNTDHTAHSEELKALAQKKGVTLPTTLPKKDQKKIDKMAKARNFDKTFVHEQGVEDHKHDIKDYEKAVKAAKDPDVKAFAEKTLPTLHKHLDQAESLAKGMKGKKA